jgi:hypothetical protein
MLNQVVSQLSQLACTLAQSIFGARSALLAKDSKRVKLYSRPGNDLAIGFR